MHNVKVYTHFCTHPHYGKGLQYNAFLCIHGLSNYVMIMMNIWASHV